MRPIHEDRTLDAVYLVLTKDELHLLEEEARTLRLSEDGTHAHVSEDGYRREITLVLADARTRGGYNDAFNAWVEETLAESP